MIQERIIRGSAGICCRDKRHLCLSFECDHCYRLLDTGICIYPDSDHYTPDTEVNTKGSITRWIKRRWILRFLLIAIMIIVVVFSYAPILYFVRAVTGTTVTVTANPNFGGSGYPTGLTLTYVDDFQVDIDWVKGTPSTPPVGTTSTVVNTIIRVKWGDAPADRFDGYQVYYGTANSFSDTAVDLTSLTLMPWYSAWTETIHYDAGGNILADIWDVVGATKEANFMSLSWMFMGIIVLATGLTVAMFITKQVMLGFPSAIFWFVFSGFCYIQSTATWDIEYFLFFAAAGMGIFSMLAAFGLRTKKEEAKEGDLYFDEGGDNDVKFVDEGKSSSELKEQYDEYGSPRRQTKKVSSEEVVGDRVRGIRERAAARRKRFDH